MVNAKAYKTEKKYLSAKDDGKLDGQIMTIDSVFESEISDNKGNSQDGLCMRFKGVEKVLVLNQTNLTACMNVWGEDTDKWINHKVKFALTNVLYNGNTVKGIQIYPQ